MPKTAAIYVTTALLSIVGILAGAPVHAGVIDTVRLEIPQRVVATEVSAIAGQTVLVLATNTPYVIKTEGVVGEMSIDFKTSGVIQGYEFGSKSRAPSVYKKCVYLDHPGQTSLFISETRTANAPGRPIDQAIVMTVTHDAMVKPKLSVHAADANSDPITSLPCA
ncbi:hypothetical protein [Robiginitomaculum antarcticum]|uniref:hypothetical protein n=1 Tax=Robiginitomaculum antarcticum TaxID=437507 RepID=UPI000367AC85|nr:hypothetical protein [Robiginitomaculum antarcticum]